MADSELESEDLQHWLSMAGASEGEGVGTPSGGDAKYQENQAGVIC